MDLAINPTLPELLAQQPTTQYAISIIIPTRNEAGNIEPLLTRINQATWGMPAEVVFVDDSTDNTPEVIRKLQDRFALKVVLVARPPERRSNGLGGAVVEGFRVASSPWACVMDADLQHPPELIPRILEEAHATGADVVVGSRLRRGGNTEGLGFKRTLISHLFALVTRTAFPRQLKNVTDPLSGFFIIRRGALDLESLRPDGFKILLEILVRYPNLRVSEIPLRFGFRHAGESKASLRETVRFFRLLTRLRLSGDLAFLRFLTVGASGLVVNSLFLAAFTELNGIHYLVSAAVATQASTLWNFGLTESWVFRGRQAQRPFHQRLFSYLLMNNLLLVLRGPLLTFMVAQLGVHYLISNLVSLFAMTILRYLVSDAWIWSGRRLAQVQALTGRKSSMNLFRRGNTLPADATSAAQSPLEPFVYSYNIHNILRIASMFRLPELEYFRVSGVLEDPDIRLRLERRRRERRRSHDNKMHNSLEHQRRASIPRRSGKHIQYGEVLGRFGFQISIAQKNCIEVAVSPILTRSLHVLYTNVIEPVVRWAFVRKGYALIHAACIAVDGGAVLVTARTDTGKTSTILRAMDNYACTFLSDDMTIVSRDGKVMSYPKPLTISQHTLSSVKNRSALTRMEKLALQVQSRLHSRSGRRIGMQFSKTKLPAATMNTIVQMLIPPPKYMVHRLIPQAAYANHAMLTRALIIERGPEFEEQLLHAQAVETFIRNAEDAYGFPPYPMLANSLSHWEEEDLHTHEQAIVADALKEIPVIRLSDPKFNWWQRLLSLSVKPGAPVIQLAGADD